MEYPKTIYLDKFMYEKSVTEATSSEHCAQNDEYLPYIRADQAEALARALEEGSPFTPDFLEWIADRLVNVYGESENVDFVLALRRKSAHFRKALEEYRK